MTITLGDPRETTIEVRRLQVVAGLFLLVKLAFTFLAGPSSDEAYYWLWGRHLALSYFDHPPLHAWLQGLSYTLFGRSLFALRWMTLATMLGTLLIMRYWTSRLAPESPELIFWRGAVAYLGSATFLLFFSVAFHDYLLAFLCLLSAHFTLRFLVAFREEGRGALRDLYLGAAVLGLAALTKYAAIFVGLGLVLTILSMRSLRPLLRNPHLYLAATLSLGMQAPVLIWNLQQGFASFRFHLVGRHATDWLAHPSLARIFEFPLAAALLLSPFLVPAIVRFFLARPRTVLEAVGQRWAVASFWITSGTFLVYSLYDYVNFWWNIPAYLLGILFLGKYIGGRFLLAGHIAFGFALNLFLLFNYVVLPVPNLFGGSDFRLSQLYGWELLEPAIRATQERFEPDFLASDMPEVANIMAFALDDPQVRSLTPLINQFDFWFDPERDRGRSALIVLDSTESPEQVRKLFGTFEAVAEVPVERFGYRIRTFSIYFGSGFTPQPL